MDLLLWLDIQRAALIVAIIVTDNEATHVSIWMSAFQIYFWPGEGMNAYCLVNTGWIFRSKIPT